MIDSHAHLDSVGDDTGAVLSRARQAGLKRILTIGTDPSSIAAALRIAETNDDVFAAVGRHPHEASGFGDADLVELEGAVTSSAKVRAIGETGLDFYRDHAPREDQRRTFIAQIELARLLELPLVIHTRAADDDTLDLLAAYGEDLTVILHCFSMPDRLEECAERGYCFSFAGNVTYPKAVELQEAARLAPAERLLVETDSPYLAPQSLRGKPNEPANVCETARFVAELRGIGYGELERRVEANAQRIFNW